MNNTVLMEGSSIIENNNKVLSVSFDDFSKMPCIDPNVLHLLQQSEKIDLTLVRARTVRVLKWDDYRADSAVKEYRKMLVMAKLGIHVVPGKDIDEIWHSHILFTKKYIDDCQDFFGYYLHHKPADGSSPEDNEKRKLSHMNMMIMYKIFFCQEPPYSWLLNYNDPCGSMGCDIGCEG